MQYKLDAKSKKLGRLATEIAILLMGKNKADFTRNKVANVKVLVENASALDIDTRKLKSKEYQKYSGYPGGRKTEIMEKLIEKKGYSEVLRKAVYGMLPSNKLRPLMMKNLVIKEN